MNLVQTFFSSWVSYLLSLLALCSVAALLTTMWGMLVAVPDDKRGQYRKLTFKVLRITANVAPSLGLVGTIQGFMRSFLQNDMERMTINMGMAMLTTYVGALLFVFAYLALCLLGKEGD